MNKNEYLPNKGRKEIGERLASSLTRLAELLDGPEADLEAAIEAMYPLLIRKTSDGVEDWVDRHGGIHRSRDEAIDHMANNGGGVRYG